MVNYDTAKAEYLNLDHEQKKQRLMALFAIFKEHSLSIQQMIPLLQADQMKEEDMVQAYGNLVDAIQSVEGEKLQKSLSQMDTLHAKMETLRQQEADEREQENPDWLLQNM